MKNSLGFLLFFGLSFPLYSQSYFTAAGLRLGTDWGITLQQRVAKRTTVEGIVQSGFSNDHTTVSVMLEQHQPLITKRLNFYLGGGLHQTWIPDINTESPTANPMGIALVAGGEFTLGRVNLSFDYKPLINLSGDGQRFDSQGGLSLRYVFIKKMKKKKKNNNWKFWEHKQKWKKKKKKRKSGLFN